MFNQFTFHQLKMCSFTNLLRFTPLPGHKKWLYVHCLSLRKLETEKIKDCWQGSFDSAFKKPGFWTSTSAKGENVCPFVVNVFFVWSID